MWGRGQITDFRIGDEVLVHLPSLPEEPLAFPAVVVSWDEIEVDAGGMPINVPGRQTTDRATMVPVKWAGYGWYDLPDKADVTLVKRARTFQRPNLAGGSGDEWPVVAYLLLAGDLLCLVPLAETPYTGSALVDHFPRDFYYRFIDAAVIGTLDVQGGLRLHTTTLARTRAMLGLDEGEWDLVSIGEDSLQENPGLNFTALSLLGVAVYGPTVLVCRPRPLGRRTLKSSRPNRTSPTEVYAVPSRQAWPIGDKRHALLAIRYMEARFGNPVDYPQIIDAIRERWGGDAEVVSELRALRRGAAAYRETLDETGSRKAAKQAGRTARKRTRASRTRGAD